MKGQGVHFLPREAAVPFAGLVDVKLAVVGVVNQDFVVQPVDEADEGRETKSRRR